jgi:hypothetical protein
VRAHQGVERWTEGLIRKPIVINSGETNATILVVKLRHRLIVSFDENDAFSTYLWMIVLIRRIRISVDWE